MYDCLDTNDIPIVQDAFGDQYIYRSGHIFRLNLESGELDDLEITLEQFLMEIEMDAIEFLSLQKIRDLREKGVHLKNGEISASKVTGAYWRTDKLFERTIWPDQG